MRLKAFKSYLLNGYLNFDLKLFDDLSFLVGINGSGKTSVLKAIMALLSPDLGWLINAPYHQVSVTIEHERQEIRIMATRNEGVVLISITGNDSNAGETAVSLADYNSMIRKSDNYSYVEEGDVLRLSETKVEIPQGNQVLQFIFNLPTPIFLGLDRTSLPSTASAGTSRTRRTRSPRRPHATLRTFLDESVSQAESLATDAIRDVYLQRSRSAAKLREDVLLAFFSDRGDDENGEPLPKASDLKKYDRSQRSLKAAFRKLGISEAPLSKSLDPFFSGVMETIKQLKDETNIADIIDRTDNKREALFRWFNFQQRLSLLGYIEELINDFNEKERSIFGSVTKYTSIMNSFFRDSNKSLSFSDESSLVLMLPSGTDADVFYLSSGERQLFVLITALMFNRDERQANVLIIDEPELSLHLKWQETFISSLREANETTQFLMATHSPSIILDRSDRCVDLI